MIIIIIILIEIRGEVLMRALRQQKRRTQLRVSKTSGFYLKHKFNCAKKFLKLKNWSKH